MFGMEVILSYEILISSLKIHLDQVLSKEEHKQDLLAQLELLDERCLRAAEHTQVY